MSASTFFAEKLLSMWNDVECCSVNFDNVSGIQCSN